MGNLTVRDIFNLSATAEREASRFYLILSEMFDEHAEIARFFAEMSRDEEDHLEWIQRLHGSVSKETLDSPAPHRAAELVQTFLGFKADDAARKIKCLDDAYKMAVRLEFSETGKLHELIIDLFERSEGKHSVMGVLNEHFEKIRAFPSKFGDSVIRSNIQPRIRGN